MYEPTKLVRLARPGEVTGHRGAVDMPTEPYLEAAKIAMDHPGVPVLVHEWGWPNDEPSSVAAISRHAAMSVALSCRGFDAPPQASADRPRRPLAVT